MFGLSRVSLLGLLQLLMKYSNILVLKILKKFGFIARMYLVREAKNKVFCVDAKGGVEKNPKSLEEAKKLGSLIAKTLIKREEKAGKKKK